MKSFASCPLALARTLAAISVVTLAATAHASDWPRWRGPDYNGISTENDWLKQWPAEGPKVLWKAAVGTGWSSVSVADGRLYTMGNTDEKDTVYALDAATGEVRWQHTYDCSSKDPNGYPGPRVTPTVDGDRVYSLSRQGHLFALEAATGKVIWSKEFQKDYGAKVPVWGFAGSPLIYGDWLIAEVGGAGQGMVAFDKKTGKEVWKAGDDSLGYSSIVPFQNQGQPALAILSANALVARSAKDGTELWRHPWKTSYDVNAATPVIADGKVFVSSGYNKGGTVVDFASGTPKTVWENKKMRNHVGTCVLWQGFLYGFDESQFKCLDFATGDEKWADGKYGKGSVIAAGDRFIVYSDKGRVAVVEPSPEGLKELAGAQVLTGKDTWAPPVLANGRLYVRALADLVALDVRAK